MQDDELKKDNAEAKENCTIEKKEKEALDPTLVKYHQKTQENDDIAQIVDDESFGEKINKSKDLIKKDKSPRKKIWSFVFVVINVVIVVAILLNMLNQENYTPLTGITFDYGFLALAVLCFIAMTFAEAWRFFSLIKKSTKMVRPCLAYKTAAYGKYYDYITPFSTGGQPFQAYYLASRGLKASHSVSIPVAKYIVHQLVFAIFCLVVLILAVSNPQLPDNLASSIVQVACWVGFGFNFILVLLFIFLSIGSFGKKTVLGILKLLHKMKIVKNYNEQYEKLLKIVEEYQKTIKFFSKSPLLLVEMVFASLLYMFAQYTTPYFIYLGFGGTPDVSMWFTCFSAALMIDLASSFIPLPGGSGMAEISFATLFASLFAGASFWALLLWRILTYYAFIVQGLILVLYDAFYGNKRNKAMQVYFKRKYPKYYNRYKWNQAKEDEIVRQMAGEDENTKQPDKTEEKESPNSENKQ